MSASDSAQTARLTPEARRLERKLARIREVYVRMPSGTLRISYSGRSGYLKRSVYALAVELCPNGQISDAMEQIEELRVYGGESFRSKDTVVAGLLNLLFDSSELSRGEKLRIERELNYARLHRIPAELLVGFLLQCDPGTDFEKRYKEKRREEWYRAGMSLVWQRDDAQ